MEVPLPRGLHLLAEERRATVLRVLARTQLLTLAGGTMAMPLVVDWNLSDTYVLPKLLLGRALALGLFVLLLLRSALERRLVLRRTPLDVPVLLLVGSAAVSTTLAINRPLALLVAYDRYEGLLTILLYAALFWLTVQTVRSAEDGWFILRSLIAGGYLAAVFSVGQSLIETARGVPTGESAFTFAGVSRAMGTMGNPTLLATLLAMLLPIAVDRIVRSRSWLTRLSWINVALVMSLALLLSFSRAGLIAAVIGGAVVAPVHFRIWRHRSLALAPVAALLIGAAIVIGVGHGGAPLGRSIADRVLSVTTPTAGSNATRLHVWADSVKLIESRPLVGYGPDTFGLAYPRFQTGDWTPGYRIDKAHADLLQVAATQGLIGVAAYLAILVATLIMFWRARRLTEGATLFGAWLGYEMTTQPNFSWLPAAAPFWILLGAAVVLCTACRSARLEAPSGWVVSAGSLAAAVAVALLAIPMVLQPALAESRFSAGLRGELQGNVRMALVMMNEARSQSPGTPVYAVAAGNLLLLDGRFDQAGQAFAQAIADGSTDPAAARSLAIIDQLAPASDRGPGARRRCPSCSRAVTSRPLQTKKGIIEKTFLPSS